MKRPIGVDGFEALFSGDPDPWNYRTSRFEHQKRGVLMHAVGQRMFGRGLELGCANGETTSCLARKCLRLTALDGSKTALDQARKRHGSALNVRFAQAVLPGDMPQGPFDLIVTSEVLYYLEENDLRPLLARLTGAVAPGGRLVFLHHHRDFDDVSTKPFLLTTRLHDVMGDSHRLVFRHRSSRFQALAFDRIRKA
ncbi:class I SAM-dependent methyltransferase [Fulvimarina sp. MAC3]|uniref:class I SAM-dependent methyltransferase n=1 Tax=Fulvimarina sp. MAC3 TaxID=3148887 RepID=UPI0031FD87DF